MNFMETQTISFVEKETKVEGSQFSFLQASAPCHSLSLVVEAYSPSCLNVIHYLFFLPYQAQIPFLFIKLLYRSFLLRSVFQRISSFDISRAICSVVESLVLLYTWTTICILNNIPGCFVYTAQKEESVFNQLDMLPLADGFILLLYPWIHDTKTNLYLAAFALALFVTSSVFQWLPVFGAA